jgi:hypothetical protein
MSYSWGLIMSPTRKFQPPARPLYPDPPPADYQDEVSERNLRALKEQLEEEFEGEEIEIISGPAW